MATNGEFSSRAYMHNKIDLVQAEAINDVINSTTKEAKKLNLMSLVMRRFKASRNLSLKKSSSPWNVCSLN